jgi:prolyl-tRNA editing enzyme YbaK/EbsC (Cys-tRNA(Pro) deacylase)
MTNIHVLSAPGRTSLAEEFRVNGAWGMGLASPSTSTNHYGYAAGAGAPSGQKPAIKIWYTTRG